MLDKNERNYFPGSDIQGVVSTQQASLSQVGIHLQQFGPTSWSGRGQQATYGIVPKVAISVMPVQGGFFLDVRMSPDFESNGLILFVVAWVLFFPVALILGFLAYQDWEARQRQLFYAVWSPVAGRMGPPPGYQAMQMPNYGPPQ